MVASAITNFPRVLAGMPSPAEVQSRLRIVAMELADFVDQHDVFVPAVEIMIGSVLVKITAERLDKATTVPQESPTPPGGTAKLPEK